MIVARRRSAVDVIEQTCLATDSVGDFVRATGADTVSKVDVTDRTKMPAVGVIVNKPTATKALVQFQGLLDGIYTGLIPGKTYCVGTSAQPVTALASVPGFDRCIQVIGQALSPTKLALNPSQLYTVIR